MKVIEPTDKQVFDSLKKCKGCMWLGGHGCKCYSRSLESCFNDEKKALTRYEYTDEEIKKGQEENTKAWDGINAVLDSWNE